MSMQRKTLGRTDLEVGHTELVGGAQDFLARQQG